MRKLTEEEFIEKAKKAHGDKYDYSLVCYKSSHTKVKIICNEHGVFEQSPNGHLNGRGCLKCGLNKRTISQTSSSNLFIEKAMVKHSDKYNYSLVEYVNARTKVNIVCKKHGVFSQTPDGHLHGGGCPKCGSYRTGLSRKLTTQEFIKKAITKHGDRYNYGLVDYKKNSIKIKIICHIHDVFNQTPSDHLNGNGCPCCGNESISIKNGSNPSGWTITNWYNKSKNSNSFDSFKVYIIRCWNDTEEFYKIGRTYQSTKRRFHSNKTMPYNYEVIKELIFDKHTEMIHNAIDCFKKEAELKRNHKLFKYFPNINFGGMHECFSEINI
ncbi:MAG: hypothetical protein [Caudoviricetes sp.]|nr:MAG: hypothetical protein [Caudoviricetes sp.]